MPEMPPSRTASMAPKTSPRTMGALALPEIGRATLDSALPSRTMLALTCVPPRSIPTPASLTCLCCALSRLLHQHEGLCAPDERHQVYVPVHDSVQGRSMAALARDRAELRRVRAHRQ